MEGTRRAQAGSSHTLTPPACTNLVAWVWAELEGGLSWSCLRAGCVWSEVQSAPETREEGRSVKLKEGTTVMIQMNTQRGQRPPGDTKTGSASTSPKSKTFQTKLKQVALEYQSRQLEADPGSNPKSRLVILKSCQVRQDQGQVPNRDRPFLDRIFSPK